MKRIWICSLTALVFLAPSIGLCDAQEDDHAQAAINELKALKLDRVELTSLTVEADKVRVEGQAFSAAQVSGLMRMIEKDIGTPVLQEISPVQSGNRRFTHFRILVAPYAGDQGSRVPGAEKHPADANAREAIRKSTVRQGVGWATLPTMKIIILNPRGHVVPTLPG